MKARVAFVSLLGLGLASCSLISCPHRQPVPSAGQKALKQLTLKSAAARLHKEGQRRERVSGLFKARLGGLKGLLASADLDVIAEEPARLHLAVQSFFSQPLKVLATDGERLTLYDAQAEGGPRFFAGPASENAAQMLLGVPLSIPAVVHALLGRPPPFARAVAHAVDETKGLYSVVYDLAGGGRATVTADAEDLIIDVAVTHPNGQPHYALHYDDFENHHAIAYAESIEVRVTLPAGEESLVLQAKQIVVNGEAFADDVFSVGLPPGSSFEAFPGGSISAPLGGSQR